MSRRPVLVALGTRPEAIKLAPVVRRLERSRVLRPVLAAFEQHAAAVEEALALFGLRPDRRVALPDAEEAGTLEPRGSRLSRVAAAVLRAADELLAEVAPAWCVVQGDTTTAFATALAAFHRGVPVAHVEAGLRTGDLAAPFPEEANRRLLAVLAARHFAPTPRAAEALRREGVAPERIELVGNTVVDALLALASARGLPVARTRVPRRSAPRVLVTCHRRENWSRLDGLAKCIEELLAARRDVEVTVVEHPNPRLRAALRALLPCHPRLRRVAPLDYAGFLEAVAEADLVLSDSGGVQEEAPLFGTRVLVLREATERPEALATGLVELAGPPGPDAARRAAALLARAEPIPPVELARYPFGDGRAAERIVAALERGP